MAYFPADEAAPGSNYGRDQRAALLSTAGLRHAQVVAFDLADCAPDAGTVTVLGKGGANGRCSPPPAPARARGAAAPSGDARPAAVPGRQGWADRAGAAAVLRWPYGHGFRRSASAPGLQPFSPHDLKRSDIGDLLDAGADRIVTGTGAPIAASTFRGDVATPGFPCVGAAHRGEQRCAILRWAATVTRGGRHAGRPVAGLPAGGCPP